MDVQQGSISIDSAAQLRDGNFIPRLGFGVWDSPSNITTQSCLEALKVGYRHIDTAQVYGNEQEVGEAVNSGSLSRGEIFVTSKILSPGSDDAATYQKTLESVNKITGSDAYLDLMLIHNVTSGADSVRKMWQAMEKLKEEGKIKSIGVSNFGIGHIEAMKDYAKDWPPVVNQLELHPWCQQREIVEYCHRNGIVIEAYCPLVRNQKANDPTLTAIGDKHGASTQQVLLRYCLQKKWIPLPKSDNAKRIAQNADIFNFALDKEDMEKLDEQKQETALVVAVDNQSKL